jgi:hypothetical protein
MRSEKMEAMPFSIREIGRAWRRRFHHPPLVKLGATLGRMPVGKGGYLTANDVTVGWDGHAWAEPIEPVSPGWYSSLAEMVFFVERASEDEYLLTAKTGHEFAGSAREAPTDALRFAALYEAPKLVHPHHARVRVDRLRVAQEPGAPRPTGTSGLEALMSTFDPENPFGLPELSPTDAGRLHAHVEGLASEYGLDWREKDIGWLEAEGALGEDWFESPMLRNEFAYLAAVHEIGHHVLGLPSDDGNGNVLFGNEVDVWKWTLEVAIIDPSEGARAQIRLCLRSYPEQLPPAEEVARLRAVAPEGGRTEMTWRAGEGAAG